MVAWKNSDSLLEKVRFTFAPTNNYCLSLSLAFTHRSSLCCYPVFPPSTVAGRHWIEKSGLVVHKTILFDLKILYLFSAVEFNNTSGLWSRHHVFDIKWHAALSVVAPLHIGLPGRWGSNVAILAPVVLKPEKAGVDLVPFINNGRLRHDFIDY